MSDGSAGAVVLDSSAVIAYLNLEAGGEKVGPYLSSGLLSSVNLCEIISKYVERGEQAEQVRADVEGLGLEIVPFTPEHALAAARLRPGTRALGLSLGDRACLALGLERRAKVLTADKAWAGLPAEYGVEVLR